MTPTLTVFTPTYNRAFCLTQLYESLCRQTSQDFLWLLIDDGSTDDTDLLVSRWKLESRIAIEYVKKANGGMHTGHNAAYARINTPLNVCIDSDDYMPDDAVANILALWAQKGSDGYAGIIGLDAFKDGRIVGSRIPDGVTVSGLNELYARHGVKGDKKVVLRTSVVREFPPYPEFQGEKLVPLGTLYKMIDARYSFLCSNDVYCIVEYLPDGSSHTIFKQYRQSPRGFRYARLVELRYAKGFKQSFTRCLHLISSSIFARDFNILKDNPKPLLTLAALPFGLLFHCYVLIKIGR